jgi:EmrB/QacA subfamily drug resistance transporter
VLLFGVTSALCAIAPNAGFLVAARTLQGVAGALLVPSSLATIVAVYPESERGAAIGSWTAWTGISTVIGPLAGGVLIGVASWRWVFALNLLPVVATLYLIARELPEVLDERIENVHVDDLGAVLCALGLAGPVFALIEQPRYGWGDPRVLLPLIVGLVLLVLFVVHEARSREPMLPLSLFQRHNFAYGNLATLLVYAGLGAALFFLTLFLQETAGYSALEAGLALLPLTILMFFLSRRFGALADRFGPRFFMSVGPIVAGAGLLLLIRLDANADYVADVLPAVAIFGFGLAMTVAPLTATVLADADEHHAGIASGVNNAIARVAGLLAIAAVGAAVSAAFVSTLDDEVGGGPQDPKLRNAVADARARPLTTGGGESLSASDRRRFDRSVEKASVRSFHVGIGISGLLVIAGGLVSAAGIQNPRRKTAAEECPGGAIYGASREVARTRVSLPKPREAEPAKA